MLDHTIQYSIRLHHVQNILLFVAVILSLAGCSPWSPWWIGAEKDVVKNGISFEAFRENENGSKTGTLKQDTRINGWPCKRDLVGFHPDWRLDEFHLFEDYVRNGISMPKGTRVFQTRKETRGPAFSRMMCRSKDTSAGAEAS
jgi:hypothetical protein